MTDERSWKPDDTRLMQWPEGEWDHRYFLWLQGPNPLPALPDTDDVEPRYMPLFEVLVCLHRFDERRLRDTLDGKFDDLDEAEAYDYACENGMSEDEKTARYRCVIRTMLALRPARDKIDDGMIDKWVEALDLTRPYSGPRA